MTYIILVLASTGSCFLVGKYLQLSRSLTYTFSIFMAIFVWQGYAIFIDGYLDPFAVIASFFAVPAILIIVMLTDIFIRRNSHDSGTLKAKTLAGVTALFLTAGPLLGYLLYTTSDAYSAYQDVPNWSTKELQIVNVAVEAVRSKAVDNSKTSLAKLSVAFIEATSTYRVMFIYQGRELAEVHVNDSGNNIVSIKVQN